MGLSFTSIGFPLFVLMISIFAGGGSLAGSINPVNFNGQNAQLVTIGCETATIQNVCQPGGPSVGTFTCFTTSDCWFYNGCPQSPPFPNTYCSSVISYTLIIHGTSVTITQTQIQNSKNNFIFGFGSIGINGFIVWIAVAIGIAALVGIQVFGTGEDPEAIHTLLMGALLLAPFLFLSGLEGFLGGSQNSFFTQLNNANAGLGSGVYGMLTLVYFIGTAKAISRGGS